MTQKEIEKANCFLKRKYNIFHADLITRAMQDERISVNQFEIGCGIIAIAEQQDKDEFIPKGWEEV
jgi:hypothetical protein